MKQIYLTFFLVLFLLSGASYAQTEQGKIIVSGSSTLNFSSEKFESDLNEEWDYKQNTFTLNPRVGYFVIDNLAVGISADIQSYDEDDYKTSYFSAGPAVRYYYDLGMVKPFAQAEITLGANKYGDGDDDKYTQFSYGAGAGVACFLNDVISFDFGVVFQNCTEKSKEDSNDKYTTKGVYFNAGFSLFF